jgi:mannosyltransferase
LRLLKRYQNHLLIFAIALAPRLLGINVEALWYDETFTSLITKLDFGNMMQAIAGDVHPPLFYILQWVIVQGLGDSEFALRLLPALCGALSALLVYKICQQLGWPAKTAWLGAILVAFSPASLYYSQDARMYTLLTCFVLAAFSASLHVLRGGRQVRWLILAALGAMFTQNYGLFFIPALFFISLIHALMAGKQGTVERIICAGMVVTVGYAALWLPAFFGQTGDVSDGFWIPHLNVDAVLASVASMTLGHRIGELFQLHVYGASLAISALGFMMMAQRAAGPYRNVLIGLLVSAPLGASVISVIWKPIWLPRGMLPSSALLMMVWAYALTNLPKPVQKVAQVLTAFAVIVGVVAHYRPVAGRDDWRAWVAPVRKNFATGDVIYHTALHTAITLRYYTQEFEYAMRPHASDLNQTLTEETKRAIGFSQADFDDLAGVYERAWLLIYLNPMSRADETSAIQSILSRYQHKLITERKNEYALSAIYLVYLQKEVQ